MIDSIVKMIAQSKHLNGEEDEFIRYQERVKSHDEWQDKIKLKEIKVGDQIDVRDTEFIWCIGIVELRITS